MLNSFWSVDFSDVEKELRALEIEEKKVLQQTTAAAKNGRKVLESY